MTGRVSSWCAAGLTIGFGAVPAGSIEGVVGVGVGTPGMTGPPASAAVSSTVPPCVRPDSRPATDTWYVPGWMSPNRMIGCANVPSTSARTRSFSERVPTPTPPLASLSWITRPSGAVTVTSTAS